MVIHRLVTKFIKLINYMRHIDCVHKCLNCKEQGVVRAGRRTESQFAKGCGGSDA